MIDWDGCEDMFENFLQKIYWMFFTFSHFSTVFNCFQLSQTLKITAKREPGRKPVKILLLTAQSLENITKHIWFFLDFFSNWVSTVFPWFCCIFWCLIECLSIGKVHKVYKFVMVKFFWYNEQLWPYFVEFYASV